MTLCILLVSAVPQHLLSSYDVDHAPTELRAVEPASAEVKDGVAAVTGRGIDSTDAVGIGVNEIVVIVKDEAHTLCLGRVKVEALAGKRLNGEICPVGRYPVADELIESHAVGVDGLLVCHGVAVDRTYGHVLVRRIAAKVAVVLSKVDFGCVPCISEHIVL